MCSKLIEAWKTNKIKKEWKIAFFATFIIGLLVHMYKFTNYLPNYDAIRNFYDSQNIIDSGRWLLSLACSFSSYYDLPWVDGILSLVFISLTMVVIVEIFKMKNPALIIIGGGILVSFPAITETFFFLYTADGYMIAMFLAAIAVYISRMETPGVWRTVIAAILICLACGIYQTYVSFALVLAICYFIFSVLKEKLETKNLFKWIGRQAIIYVAGLALYYVIWQVLLIVEGETANGYMGNDTLSLEISTIFTAVTKSVICFAWAFVINNIFSTVTVYSALNVIFIICFIVAYIAVIIKQKMLKRKLQLLLILVATVAIPFASCMWFFVSDELTYKMRMLQCLSILYIFLAVIVEEFLNVGFKNFVALLLSVIVFNYGIMANIADRLLEQSYEQSYEEADDMLDAIEDLDTGITKIAVIGVENYSGDYYADNVLMNGDYYNHLGIFYTALNRTFIYDGNHIVNFMNYAFSTDYEYATDEEVEALCELKEVQEMGTWPASDSVEVVDDYIVIKLLEIE